MSFALYRRPGGVVFLDDDPDYLEMLAVVMPPDWYTRFFLRPVDCINALQQEPPRWEADAWQQQEIINRWREGAARTTSRAKTAGTRVRCIRTSASTCSARS